MLTRWKLWWYEKLFPIWLWWERHSIRQQDNQRQEEQAHYYQANRRRR